MTRYLVGFACVCALVALSVVGCSDESTAAGGSGGTAGTGRMSGAGGGAEGVVGCNDDTTAKARRSGLNAAASPDVPKDDRVCDDSAGDCSDDDACTVDICEPGSAKCLHEPVDCSNRNECTVVECDAGFECPGLEGCSPTNACMAPVPVADGTQCAGGTCQSGACVPTGSVFPCTFQGIWNAIAAGGGPYTFACGGPTTVTTPETIVINKDVVLDGEGKLTVDGNCDHRVLDVSEGVTTELHGFTVSRGIEGGNPRGGNEIGGGIRNAGTLTLVDSTVSGNGVVFALGAGVGNEGDMKIVRSTISANTAGPFVSECCGIVNRGTLVLTNSTVAEDAGGIANKGGVLTLLNSTVSEGSFEDAVAILTSGGRLTAANTLLDGTCSIGRDGDDVLTMVISDGHNIESPGNTCGLDQGTDQVNVTEGQLKLGPLADNGGPTETHALLPGSVAIDVIPAAMCEVDTDQRGEPRDSMCDVGAFEVQEGSL